MDRGLFRKRDRRGSGQLSPDAREWSISSQALLTEIFRQDARQLARAAWGTDDVTSVRKAMFENDSFRILVLHRLRERALKRAWPRSVNHGLRLMQTAIFGVEIGKDVTLGEGTYFVHPVGTVIGGDSRIGDRVRFYGNNTVGTAKDNGYPTIEDDVIVGCGARVLGPITVGARAEIGANAVVLSDVPPDSVVVGAPARVVGTRAAMRAVDKPEQEEAGHA